MKIRGATSLLFYYFVFMLLRKIFKRISWVIPFAVSFAVADALPVDAISAGGIQTRGQQLREIRDIMRGGRGGFVDFGFYYTPLPSQLQLETPFGEHDGFAFKHHLAGFGSSEIAKDYHLGALLWFERSGWDGEDFFLFPTYNKFSHVSSNTTWGVSLTQSKADFTLAAGMQHYNEEYVGDVYPEESDSLLYSWAHLRWGKFSLQGEFYRSRMRFARLSLDLESRQVYGGRDKGLSTYLPNVDFTVYNESRDHFKADRYRLNVEQNLYKQLLYGEATFDFPDNGFRSAALKYYPDASRMVAFEASCIRRNETTDGSDDLLWGGAVEFPFVRFGYNSSYEYENFFHAKGTFIVEIQFNLASIDGFLFARGGTISAPLETQNIVKSNKNKDSKGSSFDGSAAGENSKTIEAKGIHYEKSNGGR